MPTVVSQQGPLGTSAGSRGGGVAVLPFTADKLWWPSSVQCVMFFTTSSSASCNEKTPPAKNIRKQGSQRRCLERPRALGSPLLPTGYHPSYQHLFTTELQLAIAQKLLLFVQEQGSSSPSRLKADRGMVSFGKLAACSLHMKKPDLLQDYRVQRKPPPRCPSSLSS